MTVQAVKGMFLDTLPKNQPEGTYRHALNAVIETDEGEFGAVSNELGNQYCALNFPANKFVIGHVLDDEQNFILFLYSPDNEHEIGYYRPESCEYETIMKGACLNFSSKYPVSALFKVRKGCEKHIYYTDNYNKYRKFNISDLSYVDEDKVITSCDYLDYSRNYKHPTFNIGSPRTELIDGRGGKILPGTYSFAVRYLDAELQPTDWVTTSTPVMIGATEYSSYIGGVAGNYTGGLNEENADGYYDPTLKQFNFLWSDVDQSFEYIQTAVIKRTGKAGEIAGVDVLKPRKIDSPDVLEIYANKYDDIEFSTTLEDILVPKVKLHKVKAHTFIDGRLVAANVEERKINYAAFQRHASATTVNFRLSPIASTKDNTRTDILGKGIKASGGFYRDEVYALGLVYVFKDGSTSPVFHIPGRPMNVIEEGTNPHITWDNNVWDSFELDPTDENIFNPSKNKAWQVYNTSKLFDDGLNGLCGYYETSKNYPIVDASLCDNHPDGYWGRDSYNNLITPSTKIRHHRIPGYEHENIYLDDISGDDQTQNQIDLIVTNTNPFPHEDIVGFYVVRSDREQEKTIEDTGILTSCIQVGEESADTLASFNTGAHGTLINRDLKSYGYFSNKMTLLDLRPSGSFLKFHRTLYTNRVNAYLEVPVNYLDTDIFAQTNTKFTTNYLYPTDINNAGIFLVNRKPVKSVYLQKNQGPTDQADGFYYSPETFTVKLGPHNEPALLTIFEDILPSPLLAGTPSQIDLNGGWLVSLKNERDVFENLESIIYYKSHNKVAVSSVRCNYGGAFNDHDYFIGTRYNRVGDTGTLFVLIKSIFNHSDFGFSFRQDSPSSPTIEERNSLFSFKSFPRIFSTTISVPELEEHLKNFIGNKAIMYQERLLTAYDGTLFNFSYNFLTTPAPYFPIQFRDVCIKCSGRLKNRLYYSEVDNAEKEDLNLIIRPNNYRDLDAYTGEITSLFINFGKLYAITESSLYLIPTKPLVIQSDLDNVFIGSGEFFSIEPQQVKNTNYRIGGSLFQRSVVTTEHGTFYYDNFSNTPFLVGQGIEDISLNGMRSFFKSKGELFLDSTFKLRTKREYPIKETTHRSGIGYIATYSPRYKTILLSKKDYQLNPNYQLIYSESEPSGSNFIWFDGEDFYWKNIGGVNPLKFGQYPYFYNRSFTISYSLLSKHFISFHSYFPRYWFNDSRTFYSNEVFKHQVNTLDVSALYQTFYNVKFPHIIDLIIPLDKLQALFTQSIIISSKFFLFNNQTSTYSLTDQFFNTSVIYNSNQSTGEITFNKGNLQQSVNTFSLVDNIFRVNSIRDMIINNSLPIWDENTIDLLSSVDRVPFNANIDLNKSMFTQRRFKDQFIGCRLFSNHVDNYKIVTDVVTTQNINSPK